MWPTLESRTAEEHNRTVIKYLQGRLFGTPCYAPGQLSPSPICPSLAPPHVYPVTLVTPLHSWRKSASQIGANRLSCSATSSAFVLAAASLRRALFMNGAVKLHDPPSFDRIAAPPSLGRDKTSCIIARKPIPLHRSSDRRLQSILSFIVLNWRQRGGTAL